MQLCNNWHSIYTAANRLENLEVGGKKAKVSKYSLEVSGKVGEFGWMDG